MIPISYNIRSLWVRKASTLGALVGIALVVFVLSAAMMLAQGLRKTLGLSGRLDRAIVLKKGSKAELSSRFETTFLSVITAAPGVTNQGVATIGEVVSVIKREKAGTQGKITNVQIRGVPAHVLAFRPEVKVLAGHMLTPGTDEVIIGQKLQGRFKGMELGQSFELKKNRMARVVGVFTAEGSSFESEIWADLETVRSTLGRQDLLSSVRVQLQSPEKLETFKNAIEQDKRINLQVFREDRYYEQASENTFLFINALGISIATIFSLAAMIGAMITMYASIANRTREIGTLRALGFSRAGILGAFLIETSFLSVLGGLLGVVMALLLGFVKISMVNFATWSEVVFTFTPTLPILATALVFSTLVGILGGLGPAVRAARTPALRAMRE